MAAASWTIALSLALVSAGGPTGQWLGQDGHDLVSTSITLEPNGYQDIHVSLSGLDPRRAIKTIEISPPEGGLWSSDLSSGDWKIAVERSPGSRTADLYFEADRAANGGSYQIKLVYQNGMAAELTVK